MTMPPRAVSVTEPRGGDGATMDGGRATAEFVATIHIRPKGEVRDPQGEAVAGALRSLGHDVADVRAGKEIVVRFRARDAADAGRAAAAMGDQLLANPVIEDYAVEVSPG